jgi:hypothetical protein
MSSSYFRKYNPLIIALLCCWASLHAHAAKDLVFGAMGDGPRGVEEWQMLEDQVHDLNIGRKYSFFVHVGDLWHGTERLPESHYTRAASILKQSKIPAFIVPGDNEWNDLKDPAEGWKFWTKTFYDFDKNFKKPYTVHHQDGQPENIAFVHKGVLIVGINVVGGKIHDAEEWAKRHKKCTEWIKAQFEAHKGEVRAAVVFAQARPNDAKQLDFFMPFIDHAKAFEKPVLYLHGDGHKFNIETPWRANNVWRVQIDSVGINPPLEVHVTHDLGEPFRFIRTFK